MGYFFILLHQTPSECLAAKKPHFFSFNLTIEGQSPFEVTVMSDTEFAGSVFLDELGEFFLETLTPEQLW